MNHVVTLSFSPIYSIFIVQTQSLSSMASTINVKELVEQMKYLLQDLKSCPVTDKLITNEEKWVDCICYFIIYLMYTTKKIIYWDHLMHEKIISPFNE